jgi:hypothetical protein
MRKLAIALFLLIASALIGVGISVSLSFRGTQARAEVDPNYIDGKFYRKPIHPGFITQRFPSFKTRVAVSKGRYSDGLPTAKEFRNK